MDRGMVSEDNLDYLRDREALYIVGTPKGRLRQFEKELLDKQGWHDIDPSGVKVKLVDHPDSNGRERYVICRSAARHEKEAAMFRLQRDRLREKLESMQTSIKKRRHKAETIERRIGRWMGRNTIAEKLFTVKVLSEEGYATDLQITEQESKLDWARAAQGTYLLRTNCTEEDPEKLWRWYIHLTEVEDAFRTSKSDLGMRPVYHQKQDRVQAHILICFLSLVMWRSLEVWLKSKGLGNCCRQVLDELATVKSMDVVLPVRGDREIRLRTVSKPETLAEDLLTRMELKMPSRPKIIRNVVEKN
jgi:transposase